jgi:hypothetical protein
LVWAILHVVTFVHILIMNRVVMKQTLYSEKDRKEVRKEGM